MCPLSSVSPEAPPRPNLHCLHPAQLGCEAQLVRSCLLAGCSSHRGQSKLLNLGTCTFNWEALCPLPARREIPPTQLSGHHPLSA